MTIRSVILALLVWSTGFETLSAQESSSQAAPLPPSVGAKVAESVQDVRVNSLQEQVQTLKDFTQHILATVYFALSAVIVVVIAMLGFSWYQNFRVYERDKEAMRQQLVAAMSAERDTWTKQFDAKIANALEVTNMRIDDVRLSLATDIFRAAHFPRTPQVDTVVFCSLVEYAIGRVNAPALTGALTMLIEHARQREHAMPSTPLLTLASRLPPEYEAYGTQLKALATGHK